MLKKCLFLLVLCLPYYCSFSQDYEVVRTLSGHRGGVQNIRFSPDGKLLASCGKDDYRVIIWNVANGKIIRTLTGHKDIVYEVTFDKTGNLVASASKDGTVRVWETNTGTLVGNFENQPVISPNKITYNSVVFVCFSQDSKYVFFGGDNGFLCKAKLGKSTAGAFYRSKRLTQVNTHNPHEIISITGGALSPDSRGIMTSIDHFVHITDIKSEQIVKTFYYPFAYLNDVIAGPGKNKITTWSYDGKVTIWDYNQEKILQSFQVTATKNYSVASYSPDGGKMTTAAFGNSARVWNWQAQQAVAKLSEHTNIVRISRFSTTEDLIATASYDGYIKLWEPTIEEEKNDEDITEEEIDIDLTPPLKFPGPAPKKPIYLLGEVVDLDRIIELENVQFEQSQYYLTDAAKKDLDQVGNLLKENPSIEIEIHGHTDTQGHAIQNYQLSERRANVSKAYLVEMGIASHRISIKAFGEKKPIANDKDEHSRKQNRRVEIKITKL